MFFLAACEGAKGPAGDPGTAGKSCTAVEDTTAGTVTITCDDGNSVTLKNGTDGAAGTDGRPCAATSDTTAGTVTITCPGSDPVVVANGTDGTNGQSCTATPDVEAGTVTITCPDVNPVVVKNGTSCTVTDNEDGSSTISCDDGTSATVSNGTNGKSCTVVDNGDGTKSISCDDGTSVTVSNGTNGTSCTVVDNGNGTKTISCGDGTSVTVANGANGSACSVKDNNNGTKTISCSDGTSVTVSNGTNGLNGGNDQITNYHGITYLTTTGEYANGLKTFATATITGVTVDAAGTVTVDYKVADAAGKPVLGLTAVQANIVKLVDNQWIPYIRTLQTVSGSATGTWPNPDGTKSCQGGRENSGTKTDLGAGNYRYVFKNKLGAYTCDGAVTTAFEPTLTHRVSIMMGGHSGVTADTAYDFVPDGSAVVLTRNMIPTSACKSCHGPLFDGHGGDRLTVENCVTCHNAGGGFDPHGGESIDMAVMIHKIHAGAELPSVAGPDWTYFDNPATPADESADNGEYAIWGNSNSKHEWHGEFPAVLDNCTKCHTGTGAQVDYWKTLPTRKACGACHDNIDWDVGTNHDAGPQEDDASCKLCHSATKIVGYHDFTNKDVRNIPEFDITATVSAPADGKSFQAGEQPVVSIVLKKKSDGSVVVPSTFVEDPAKGGCTADTNGVWTCPAGNGKFPASNLYVTGPRDNRQAVLTYSARAKVLSSSTGPFDISAAVDFKVKLDNGQNVVVYDENHGDTSVPATVTVTVASGTFVDKTVATVDEMVTWLNGNAAFKARAIAYKDEQTGKLGVRSRSLGKLHAIQLLASNVATAVFGVTAGQDGTIAFAGGGPTISKRTSAANQDPLVDYTDATAIKYKLDPVDDLAPGTYVVDLQIADIGNNTSTVAGDYKTPSVAWVTFNVKTSTTEKLVADSCNTCHQNADGKGYVLDFPRHNKQFSNDAVDHCAACHDYQPSTATGLSFSGGGVPIVKRVHAVHMGVDLTYPLATVAHEDGTPGRQWQIEYPQDIRNCESCHSAATSGSWKTNPSRLACGSCHDSDAATAHINIQTYDPTPANAFSGDEVESCASCH